jgi:hypothetical protein
MKKKNKPKYEFGTGKNGVVRHYIESPSETMTENDIMMAKAKEKAANNGWAQGINILGNMAIQYGASMGGGTSGLISGAGDGVGQVLEGDGFKSNGGFGEEAGPDGMLAAFGGTAKSKVEVEGEETAKLPDGGFIDFEGPSHEEGGINTNLPVGTDIFSKRIKIGGETMAERETSRSKGEFSLEKLLNDNETDTVLKATLKRTKSNNNMEREQDKRLQAVVRLMKGLGETRAEGEPVKFADGGSVMGTMFRGLFGGEDEDGNEVEGTAPNFTGGDLVGLAGTLYSAFAPGKNTEKNRAGDTPNINAFEDFGNDALDRLDEAKGFISGQKENALQDVQKNRSTASAQNRKTARGVNTLRALDVATDANVNDATGDIYDNFAKQMMGLLTKQAGLENEQDTKVMAGEQTRDDNDRRDRDNYFSQLAKDIATKGQGIQQAGKMLNENKKNTVSENLLNDTSKGYQVDANGNILLKNGDKELSVEESTALLTKQAEALGLTLEEYQKMLIGQ